MTREFVFAAFDAVGFAVGAALCLLLGVMQYRVDRPSGRASGYQVLWLVGFLWTSGRFAHSMLELAGVPADSLALRIAESLAWSGTIVGPIAMGRFLYGQLAPQTRLRSMVMPFAATASSLNLILFCWAAATHELRLDTSPYPEASFYIALTNTVLALAVYMRYAPPRVPDSPHRWWPRSIAVLAGIQIFATLLGMQSETLPPAALTAINAIGEQWAIPWSILVAVSMAQVHHADLVLKRSLLVLCCTGLSALVSLWLLDPRTSLELVAMTLAGSMLLLAAQYLQPALERVVDRLVLRRPDYAAAATDFEISIRRVSDDEQLMAQLLEVVRSTLHLDAQVADHASDRSMLTSIPVGAADRTHLVVLDQHQGRRLMQQELEFLRAIASHVMRRREALQFEREQQVLLVREERLKRLLSEAELKALRTQVDPHFLFNTLNTIADLIATNPDQAERMIERLAECFRYALARHSQPLSTLDDEFDFARQYLSIEQVRFGERLRVELSRGNARGDEAIPSLLLQPLLENAIKHGLASVREGGHLHVTAERAANHLNLQVVDDGIGIRESSEPRGIGLQNVRQRLETLYSQEASMKVAAGAAGRGTTVTIRVPLHDH